MRKHDQRVRKLLGGQEGSMAPLAVAAAIAMLIIILGGTKMHFHSFVITEKEG